MFRQWWGLGPIVSAWRREEGAMLVQNLEQLLVLGDSDTQRCLGYPAHQPPSWGTPVGVEGCK